MKKKKIIIACSKKWFLESLRVRNFLKSKNIKLITRKKKLNLSYLNKLNPSIIFFPHWSYKVNQEIIKKYKCVCFHTAPLPYGRGGTPIQNLILKNFKKSPVCALKMTNEYDAGPIYQKRIVSLSGTLDQIFERISLKILDMIRILIKKKIKPKKQIGKIYRFKRIKKENSEIKNEKNITEIYNKIRMLNADGYPSAYIKFKNIKIFLTNPILKKNSIFCDAKIFRYKN